MHRILLAVLAALALLTMPVSLPTAQAATSPIATKYAAEGGSRGHLGPPVSGEYCGLKDGGCFQRYQNGSIYWSKKTGAHFVRGRILANWGTQRWETGHLGYPTSDEQCWIKGGCFQTFQDGSIYWSPATDAHYVKGSIRQEWGRQGWEAGFLGYPITNEICGLRAGGCFQRFQGGSVYWSPGTGAHFVRGAIRDRWGTLGWESLKKPYDPMAAGWFDRNPNRAIVVPNGHDLGYPTSNENCGFRDGGCYQNFERGRIYWSRNSGAHPVVPSANGGFWTSQGAERSKYGYPTSEERCDYIPNSEIPCSQKFQHGDLSDYPAPGYPDFEFDNVPWAW